MFIPFITGGNAQPRWSGPDGGSVVSLAVDPYDGNIVYAGTFGAGVYKSIDGGASWKPASEGITNVLIHNLAIDPVETNRIYAGTYRSGVFRSEDGGQTWVSASSGMQGQPIVYGLATNVRGNHNMVYAGTRDSNVDSGCSCPPWRGVLYKSWDFGNTWTQVLYNIGGPSVQDWVYAIAVDPANENNVLAATHEHGIYRTDAYGGSLNEWFPSNDGLNDFSPRALVFNLNGKRALTGVFDHDGMYGSANEGASWNLSNSGLGWARVFPNALAVTNANRDTVYTASMKDSSGGQTGVFRSDNGGASWYQAGLSGLNIYAVRASPTNASVVYAGAQNSGLYKSTNGGASWFPSMRGIANTNVTGVVRPTPGLLMISTYGSGVFYSLDAGQNWSALNTGLGDLRINGLYFIPGKPYILYALTQSAGLKRFDLSLGGTWSAAGAVREPLESQAWESGQAFAVDGAPVQVAPGEDPYRLIDPADDLFAGDSNPVKALPSINAPLPSSAPLISMVFAPSNPDVRYVGTNGSGVYMSMDGGLTWSHSITGIQGVIVRGLAVFPTMPQIAYAATSENGAFKWTDDGGITWSTLYLPDRSLGIYSIAVTLRDDGSLDIYVGTSNGLWRWRNNQWEMAGLSGSSVTALAFSPLRPGFIYAGTTNGAYVSRIPGQWELLSSMTLGHTIQTIAFDYFGFEYIYLGATSHGVFIFPTSKP